MLEGRRINLRLAEKGDVSLLVLNKGVSNGVDMNGDFNT